MEIFISGYTYQFLAIFWACLTRPKEIKKNVVWNYHRHHLRHNYHSGCGIHVKDPPHHRYTLMQSSRLETLDPGYFYYANFTIPWGASSISISRSYISSGDVNPAIISSSEFSNVVRNPSAMTYGIWYSGHNMGTTISVSLSPGSYTLIFYNSDLITLDTISAVNGITLSYSS